MKTVKYLAVAAFIVALAYAGYRGYKYWMIKRNIQKAL
jgi:hypothetical protein